MNKVILMGRLAQDPEVRYTQSGKAVASFSLAVSRYGGSAQNDTTDFIPIVAWEKLAEICGNNLSKGRRILLEGRIQIRSYEDSNGQKRKVTEVVASQIHFVDSKKDTSGGSSKSNGNFESMGQEAVKEEEIPF